MWTSEDTWRQVHWTHLVGSRAEEDIRGRVEMAVKLCLFLNKCAILPELVAAAGCRDSGP